MNERREVTQEGLYLFLQLPCLAHDLYVGGKARALAHVTLRGKSKENGETSGGGRGLERPQLSPPLTS